MGRYKKRELIHAGVDYVRAVLKVPAECALRGLSANTNQMYFELEGKRCAVTKMEITDKYPYYFAISYDTINLGFIGFGGNSNPDFIEITGQGLTVFGIRLFYHVMDTVGLEFVRFKRVDVCFDLAVPTNYFADTILLEKFKTESENFSFFRTKKNGWETMYFGKKKYSENTYMLNRIYNKIVDSKKKGKLFLYDMYKDENGTEYKDVTRFESELREDLVRYYPYRCLMDEKFIFYRLVKSFFKYNPQYFKFLHEKDFSEYQAKVKRDNKVKNRLIREGLSDKPNNLYQARLLKIVEEKANTEKYGQNFIDDEDRNRTLTMFLSMTKKLYKNGYTIERIQELVRINCE